MATTRIGTTKQYADNWENIFGGGRKATKGAAPKIAAKKKPAKSVKPPVKKKAGKKAK